MSVTPIKQRLRIVFGKYGPVCYTSNLDIAKVWERVLRRAELPIYYSKGFNTRPRLQLALALPLGYSSDCELLDVFLRESIDIDGIAERLNSVSPEGLQVKKVESVPVEASAAETQIVSAEYLIRFPDAIDAVALRQRVEDLLNLERLVVVHQPHKGRKSASDMRSLIVDLRVDDKGQLDAHLAAGSRGSMRPDQLMNVLGLSDEWYQVHRYRLHFLR